MYYMIGDITMESKMPSVGGFLKAALSSESIFRPTYTGTGELYLELTAGGIHSMHLDNETWILENGPTTARRWESRWTSIVRKR